ncbi:MAG: aldehyde dehydrogenase family protein, partial [Pseudomonadota bacterium]
MPKDAPRAFEGRHLIDGRWTADGTAAPSTPWRGEGHPVFAATEAEVDAAARAADAAFETLYATDGATRAALLDRIAAEIEARGDAITAIGHAETALPEARLSGERAR